MYLYGFLEVFSTFSEVVYNPKKALLLTHYHLLNF